MLFLSFLPGEFACHIGLFLSDAEQACTRGREAFVGEIGLYNAGACKAPMDVVLHGFSIGVMGLYPKNLSLPGVEAWEQFVERCVGGFVERIVFGDNVYIR
jgi:hypothetical protein